MRRCYRNAALVIFGTFLFTSGTFSTSCGFTSLEVYAKEIQTGEENVETEIPAEETKNTINLEYNEYDVLLRIVEAEAGSEDMAGKMLVANVIMNRVKSDRFPNTVTEVVYQTTSSGVAQFSPTVNGTINTVTVSEETVTAVERVLNGEDSSNGALFFRSVHSRGTWHDSALSRIIEHGNHIFYTI